MRDCNSENCQILLQNPQTYLLGHLALWTYHANINNTLYDSMGTLRTMYTSVLRKLLELSSDYSSNVTND